MDVLQIPLYVAHNRRDISQSFERVFSGVVHHSRSGVLHVLPHLARGGCAEVIDDIRACSAARSRNSKRVKTLTDRNSVIDHIRFCALVDPLLLFAPGGAEVIAETLGCIKARSRNRDNAIDHIRFCALVGLRCGFIVLEIISDEVKNRHQLCFRASVRGQLEQPPLDILILEQAVLSINLALKLHYLLIKSARLLLLLR